MITKSRLTGYWLFASTVAIGIALVDSSRSPKGLKGQAIVNPVAFECVHELLLPRDNSKVNQKVVA